LSSSPYAFFRISWICFTTIADGFEKFPVFVIGKVAWPRAFNKKTGAQSGFYYRNSAKAWMTVQLYQDWIPLQPRYNTCRNLTAGNLS
jgi:hypothetical protein